MQDNLARNQTRTKGAPWRRHGAARTAPKAVDREVPIPKSCKKRKLTDETQTQICAMISVGCSMRRAARLAGCSESAIRNLLRRDEAFAKRLREASMRREICREPRQKIKELIDSFEIFAANVRINWWCRKTYWSKN